jgi:hypothetical protein
VLRTAVGSKRADERAIEEAGMADDFNKGDKVEWNSPQGKVEGEVKEKITSEKTVGGGKGGGQKVKGSKHDPRYRVESDKTGAEAAHKPDALEKK